jgi:hypothetical protein
MTLHWKIVQPKSGPDSLPRPRSLHAGVVVNDVFFYVFAGFDGSQRLNDLHRFDFVSSTWTQISAPNGPSPRDRLAAVSVKDSMYIFGGFDGTSRVNDLWRFDTVRNVWSLCEVSGGQPPSARHSHSAVEWNGKIFILFGYDGNYKSDISEFNISRKTWMTINARGSVPPARYRSSVVVYRDCMYSFGGHDGSRHLDDFFSFDFRTNTWTLIEPVLPVSTMGPYAFRTVTPCLSTPPAPRDSHSALTYGDSMFVFGGSSGSARNDLFEYRFDLNAWIELQPHGSDSRISPRFCHVAALHRDCMYIHSGYDGQARLGDFVSYSFVENVVLDLPPPTILSDLRSFINQPEFSDIELVCRIDGCKFFGHKIILSRCLYFAAMFGSCMQETTKPVVELSDISGPVLEAILKYLYTDEFESDSSVDLMTLFTTADKYGIDRLKRICEQSILSSMTVDNSCAIFRASDLVSAETMRSKTLEFIVRNYEAVVKTTSFEELARSNVELTLEIIRRQRN